MKILTEFTCGCHIWTDDNEGMRIAFCHVHWFLEGNDSVNQQITKFLKLGIPHTQSCECCNYNNLTTI